jgi:hypothetical protein
MAYTIKFSDGSTHIEPNYTCVLGILAEVVGDDFAVGDEEQDGMVDVSGYQPMRRLVWASEEDSEGDDGSRAVATVRWTE